MLYLVQHQNIIWSAPLCPSAKNAKNYQKLMTELPQHFLLLQLREVDFSWWTWLLSMEGSHARLEKHLPPYYLSSISTYLPTSLWWLLQLAYLTLPSSYYSSFYTLLQNAILQIEHIFSYNHIFVPHVFTVSYDVNLASQCSHLELLLLSKFWSKGEFLCWSLIL